MPNCMYCKADVRKDECDVYKCSGCGLYVHLACTNCNKTSRLKGDYLFQFQCKMCNFDKIDAISRMKLNWVQIIHLALYNLTILENGRQGFFRWKEEICTFIEQNWMNLMPGRTKTTTWSSTVAGALSVHSPKLFKSGQYMFKEPGWWGLQEVSPPFRDSELYKTLKTVPLTEMSEKKAEAKLYDDPLRYGRGKRQKKDKKADCNNVAFKIPKMSNDKTKVSSIPPTTSNTEHEIHAPPIPKIKIKLESGTNAEQHSPKAVVDCQPMIIKPEPVDTSVWEETLPSLPVDEDSFDGMEFSYDAMNFSNMDFSSVDDPFPLFDDALSSIRSVQCDDASNTQIDKHEEANHKDLIPNEFLKRELVETPTPESEIEQKKLVSLTPKEELEFLSNISSYTNVMECDSSVRRLYRKLQNRKLKREIGLEIFNLDVTVNKLIKKTAPDSMKFLFSSETPTALPENKNAVKPITDDNSYHHPALQGVNVLDRFDYKQNLRASCEKRRTTLVGMIGNAEDFSYTRSITSPYTSRVLKPYIRRDFDTLPPKLQILKQIQELRSPNTYKRWPIDYCYVQPNHIPAVNALCGDFFWPGIDVTECLNYPEFSCVVLYGRLLIGFAFMVPDVSYNEAYISFILVHPDWQRAGIATNMIYHLIQTCMGKDVTLHVSPSNPSMMLYHKFGFKAEELILDFYQKYLPEDSKTCKHAFLLRLQR
ncbi:cysteine-rich protein 2-binding protein-like [Hydractinia symbiolongicarpus]|uniref:cysteine-rich protein 2-binding protein-like n=1 Tax=Hydractinia symbiolongicarpus TaxID=13093 RepID=UPI002549DB11|nr:cysteine-rich protein 2-binding protein-like [Hydractinia symbiolongicarpus]